VQPSVVTTASAPPPAPPKAPPPDAAGLFARIRAGLARCYDEGKKAAPAMADGKLTLNASIDDHGVPGCVIPSDDTGLTQEVEDCMSARLAAERFEPGAPFATAVPVAVRSGSVELGARTSVTVGIESVETHRMPDAFDVLESLVPELQACVRAASSPERAGPSSILVGARVKTDGRTECALATPAIPDVSACTTRVFLGAKFPPPKGGPGLVLVPIALQRR
jgi:hypothetical protein